MTEKRTAAGQQLRRGGGWTIALGVLAIVAGVISIAAPVLAAGVVVTIVGVVILVTGLVQIVGAFREKSFELGAGDVLGGLLYVVAGGILLAAPLFTASVLGILLAVFFFVRGVTQIAASFQWKPRRGWGWLLFGGILAVVFGLMLVLGQPLSGVWAIGIFLGIELLFTGWSLIFLGGDLRDVGQALAGGPGA